MKRPSNFIVANAILWALTYLLITGRMAAADMPYPTTMALRRLVPTAFGFFACLAMTPLLARVTRQAMWRRLVWAVGLSALGGLGYTLCNYLIFNVALPPLSMLEPFSLTSVGVMASIFFWTFLAWCALFFALSYEADLRDERDRLVAAEAAARDAQHQMLRYQINPHFLFNTLNALSSLILARENDRAERVVLSLSEFLRQTLEQDPPEKRPLECEVAAQRQYLVVEQARFEDRLNYIERIPDELKSACVPSLVLQPLVENAVKYGVARSSRPVTIEIEAVAEGERLRLSVRDDGETGGSGAEPPHLGLGLENVRRRLALIYGDAARLEFGPQRPSGFAAVIETPLERP